MNRIFLAISALLAFAGGAFAHDYWLVPETFTPKDGAKVPVRMFVGEAHKPEQEVGYASKKTTGAWLVTAKRIWKDLEEPQDGDKPAFAFKMRVSGTAVFRVDREWASITLKADKFTAYLKEEGLDEIIKLRAAAGESEVDGKERYRRYLKAVVHGGGKPDDTPTEPLGQTFEIVPAKNPYAMKPGEELPVVVLFEEKPLAGLKLTAYHRDGDTLTAVNAITDKDGKASLKLAKSGPWVVRGVHMRRVKEKNPDPPADWESFWASVTFELPRGEQ